MPRKLKKRAMRNQPTLRVSSDPAEFGGKSPKALRDSPNSRSNAEAVLQGWLLPELVQQLGFSVTSEDGDKPSDLDRITRELSRLSGHPLGRLVYKMVGLVVPGARPKFVPLSARPKSTETDQKCLALASYVVARLAQPARPGFPKLTYAKIIDSSDFIKQFRAGEGRRGEKLSFRQTRNRYNRGRKLLLNDGAPPTGRI